MVVRTGRRWPFDDIWPSDHLRVLVHPRWRPAADAYETASTLEILVDLAGVGEDDMIVTYLEWLAGLPWRTLGGAPIDLHHARQVLDQDHFDLKKIKDRILEYLAVKKLRQERGSVSDGTAREPILCFVGPPGVGKVLTAHGDDGARDRALAAGALAFLTKPFDADVLLGAVSVALRPR